jgi:hypothetical protein
MNACVPHLFNRIFFELSFIPVLLILSERVFKNMLSMNISVFTAYQSVERNISVRMIRLQHVNIDNNNYQLY